MENDDELGPDADRGEYLPSSRALAIFGLMERISSGHMALSEQPYPGQRRFGEQGFEDSNWARPT
jgi:hypothetical protein